MPKTPPKVISLPALVWDGVSAAVGTLVPLTSNNREVTFAATDAQLEQVVEHLRVMAEGKFSDGSVLKVKPSVARAASEAHSRLSKKGIDAAAQAGFRGRRHELGQKEVRGIWADPSLHFKIKQAAQPHVGADGYIAGVFDSKPRGPGRRPSVKS